MHYQLYNFFLTSLRIVSLSDTCAVITISPAKKDSNSTPLSFSVNQKYSQPCAVFHTFIHSRHSRTRRPRQHGELHRILKLSRTIHNNQHSIPRVRICLSRGKITGDTPRVLLVSGRNAFENGRLTQCAIVGVAAAQDQTHGDAVDGTRHSAVVGVPGDDEVLSACHGVGAVRSEKCAPGRRRLRLGEGVGEGQEAAEQEGCGSHRACCGMFGGFGIVGRLVLCLEFAVVEVFCWILE